MSVVGTGGGADHGTDGQSLTVDLWLQLLWVVVPPRMGALCDCRDFETRWTAPRRSWRQSGLDAVRSMLPEGAFVDEVSVTAGHWTVCKIESATG